MGCQSRPHQPGIQPAVYVWQLPGRPGTDVPHLPSTTLKAVPEPRGAGRQQRLSRAECALVSKCILTKSGLLKNDPLSRIWTWRRSSLPCCSGQRAELFHQSVWLLFGEIISGHIILYDCGQAVKAKPGVPVTQALCGFRNSGKGLAQMPHFKGTVLTACVCHGCVTNITSFVAQSLQMHQSHFCQLPGPCSVCPRLRSRGSRTVGLRSLLP